MSTLTTDPDIIPTAADLAAEIERLERRLRTLRRLLRAVRDAAEPDES